MNKSIQANETASLRMDELQSRVNVLSDEEYAILRLDIEEKRVSLFDYINDEAVFQRLLRQSIANTMESERINGLYESHFQNEGFTYSYENS